MIINIKLKNGCDLIGQAESIETIKHTQQISNPLKIEISPEYGLAMTLYAAFAKDATVTIPRSEFVYVAEASDVAVEKYTSVMSGKDTDEEDDEHNDNGMYSMSPSTKYIN